MFKATAVLAMVAAAEAFRPSGRMATSKLSMKKATSGFEEEIGALPPVGFWDPLGLAADGDKAVFDRRRASELKHGRIAMLAAAGWIFTYFHNPVLGVGPLEAHNAAVASGAGAQVLTAIAALEFIGTVALKQTFDGQRAPGDFSFDPLNLYGKLDTKAKETMQLK